MTAGEICALRPISEVWQALGGDPLKHGRARAFWRDGSNNPQAVSLSDDKGAWYDHRDNVGGGVLDLVQRVRGCTRSDALKWLADLNGSTLEDRPTTERREFARRRDRAGADSQRILDWRSGRLFEIEGFLARETAEALSAGVDPSAVLAKMHRTAHWFRTATAHDLVSAYGRALAADEAEVVRLEAVGREDREDAERVTWCVVDLLAQAQEVA
jgi:hypothetical protein